ncbi:MAG: hypothetical protein ACXVI3_05355 [Halobacteriota archaeon]
MRSITIYPWQLDEFMQWLKPDVRQWNVDAAIPATFQGSYEQLIKRCIIPHLSHCDFLEWFENGRLIGVHHERSREIAKSFIDYRFNGLFYSGLFDTQGETEW